MSNLTNPSEKSVDRKSKSEAEVTQQIARITSKLVGRANNLVSPALLNDPRRRANSIVAGDSRILVTTPAGLADYPVKQIAVEVKGSDGSKHYHDAAAERSHGARTLSDDRWTGHSGNFYLARDDEPSQATANLTQDEVIQGSAETLSAIRDTVTKATTSSHQKAA